MERELKMKEWVKKGRRQIHQKKTSLKIAKLFFKDDQHFFPQDDTF